MKVGPHPSQRRMGPFLYFRMLCSQFREASLSDNRDILIGGHPLLATLVGTSHTVWCLLKDILFRRSDLALQLIVFYLLSKIVQEKYRNLRAFVFPAGYPQLRL